MKQQESSHAVGSAGVGLPDPGLLGDPAFTEARGALLAFNAERCPVPGESSGEA